VRIIKLPDGRVRIPVALTDDDCDADATETIGPNDPRYPAYWVIALTEEEHAARDSASEAANAELLARWSTHSETQQGQQQVRPPSGSHPDRS
jgi:hypothetical protein